MTFDIYDKYSTTDKGLYSYYIFGLGGIGSAYFIFVLNNCV